MVYPREQRPPATAEAVLPLSSWLQFHFGDMLPSLLDASAMSGVRTPIGRRPKATATGTGRCGLMRCGRSCEHDLMKPTLAIAALLSTCVLSNAEDQDQDALPAEAATLLSRLTAWEEQQSAQYEEMITKRRAEVSRNLKELVQRATKADRLDEALAVRAAISALKAAPTGAEADEGADGFGDYVGIWNFWEGSQWLFLSSDGTAYLAPQGYVWTVGRNKEGDFLLYWKDGTVRAHLRPKDESILTFRSGADGKGQKWDMKRKKLRSRK